MRHRKSNVFYAVGGLGCAGVALLYIVFAKLQSCQNIFGSGTEGDPAGTPADAAAQTQTLRPEQTLPGQAPAPPPPVEGPPALVAPSAAPPKQPAAEGEGSLPPAGTYSAVGLAAVADANAQSKFAVSLASQRCYAERYGYEYMVLDPRDYPCKQRDFFFRKHCTVARFLEKRPADYILFVFDGDNPIVTLGRNLDTWLAEARATDVVLYERWMNNEIMAGNYIVRNSAWGIGFCDGWASYDGVDQPSGYHSSDNGAIHLHVLRSLQISNWEYCAHLWDRLSASVMNLDPYYAFVACTRLAMGAPRRWKLDGSYRVTILPRGHAWAIDGVVANSKTAPVGPISHHGQKTRENYLQYFRRPFVDGPKRSCDEMERNDISVDAKTFAGFLTRNLQERLTGNFQAWSRQAPPPWDFAYLKCIRTFSCRPLDDDAGLAVTVPRPSQKALPFMRIPDNANFQKCAKEHDSCDCVGLVRFGTIKDKKLSPVLRISGAVRCNAQSFAGNDPAPGVGKFCYCAAGL